MDEEPLNDKPTIGDNLLCDIFAGIAMHATLMNMANLKEGIGLGKTAYEAADAMMLYRCKKPTAAEGVS